MKGKTIVPQRGQPMSAQAAGLGKNQRNAHKPPAGRYKWLRAPRWGFGVSLIARLPRPAEALAWADLGRRFAAAFG